jgi:SWI/SNF-related matrix-associated actin-dependent regulator of chromatin subfamily B protein 1
VTNVIDRSRPRKIPDEEANKPELLVPLRLELDIEHHKMRDTFVWNLNGLFYLERYRQLV